MSNIDSYENYSPIYNNHYTTQQRYREILSFTFYTLIQLYFCLHSYPYYMVISYRTEHWTKKLFVFISHRNCISQEKSLVNFTSN